MPTRRNCSGVQPHAQVVRVENAGHSVQGDAPIELAEIIVRFVDGAHQAPIERPPSTVTTDPVT